MILMHEIGTHSRYPMTHREFKVTADDAAALHAEVGAGLRICGERPQEVLAASKAVPLVCSDIGHRLECIWSTAMP